MALHLNDRAMLVGLTISMWSAHKHDRAVSQEVAQQHGNDVRLGRFNKRLVDGAALKAVQSAAGLLRSCHYTNTLPWSDAGPRILTATNYLTYTQAMREKRQAFEGAVHDFVGQYRDHIAAAERQLGDLFRESEYPSLAEIEGRFGIDIQYLPLPDSNDFRVDLGDIEEARIRKEIEARVEETIQAAHRSLWERCHEAVSHMAERLSAYQKPQDGRASGVFRDTLVTNIRELVDLLPRLNLTGDPELEAMRRRIEKELAQEDPATLRENETVRKSVASAAASILADMAGWCGEMPEAAE